MVFEKNGGDVGDQLSDTLLSYLKIAPTPLMVTKSNKVLWINGALEDLLAIGIADVIGQDISQIVTDELPSIKMRVVEGPGTAHHNTGREIAVNVVATPVGHEMTVIKITPMLLSDKDAEITIYRERLWVLANQIRIGIFYSEVGARIQFANDAMAQIYESPIEALLGTGWIDQIPPKQREKVEKAVLETLSGQTSSVEIQIATLGEQVKNVLFTFSPIISSDSRFGFAATAEDITDRLLREHEMERAALYDSLTGLGNRVSLNQTYYELLEAVHTGTINSITAIFCDLNKFKIVNDTYGHNAGDKVLVSFATALSTTLKPYLVPYRYAGDEFVILGTNLTDEESRKVTDELRANTSLEVKFNNQIIKVSASFGYHTTTLATNTLTELIAEADMAMYKEKQETKARGDEI